MSKTQIFKLITSLVITLSVGAIAGLATSKSVSTWYTTLNPPSFNPPNWVFGPVWTTLYILLGISLFLVWREEDSGARNRALLVFSVQLSLNFAWSFIFFYFHEIGWALLEIVLLLGSILLMLWHFRRIKPLAAYMNIPYLLWVGFAAALNAAYFWLN